MTQNPDITLFAKTNFRNREVAFGIRRDDRRRHMYVIGKTGMGKTTMIENMVIQDIQNGEGLAFVDPHGDSVEKVLDYVPASRINDVVYLNPADTDFPIAFNPLEAVDIKYKHLVASGLMGVFTKMWAGVWSARMEYILNNTVLALLDSPGNTLLGIARMLVNKTYRKKIVDNIKDPVVKSFWVDEFANYNEKFRTEAIAPIQNKVGQFLSSAIIRNIVGQTKSSIDLREIMDQKKILLLNLSKGRIGEDNSALLGAMIVTKLQLAAMSRVDIPEEDRKDFYLYVDEFQNFATESFASILSEARKYRLNLIVAHQYIGQLVQDKNTIVRDAIFGNVGTMVVFRVGADDAEFLEKEFEPTYLLNDLVNLTKYSVYMKLMINGVASKPFSAGTLPPISVATGTGEKVIKVSRERYGTQREIVEEKISKWLGAEFHAEAARVESDSVHEEGMQDNMRFENRPGVASAPARPANIASAPARPASIASAPARTPTVAASPVPSVNKPASAPMRAPTPPPAPAAPRPPVAAAPAPVVEKVVPLPVIKKPQAPPPPRPPVEKVDHREEKTERLHIERRLQESSDHPNRRSTDPKSEKPKPKPVQNPVWDTVTKISQDKMKERVEKTTAALESLSKSLEQSLKPASKPQAPAVSAPQPQKPLPPPLVKHEPITIPAAPPVLPKQEPITVPTLPKHEPIAVPVAQPEKHWEPIIEEEPIPQVQDEIELEPGDPNPPSGSLQSHLTMIEHREHPAVTEALKKVPKVNLKPGDKVKF